jgi:hypothetical protein
VLGSSWDNPQQSLAKPLTIRHWFLQEASQVARGMSTTELRLNKNLLQKVKEQV